MKLSINWIQIGTRNVLSLVEEQNRMQLVHTSCLNEQVQQQVHRRLLWKANTSNQFGLTVTELPQVVAIMQSPVSSIGPKF